MITDHSFWKEVGGFQPESTNDTDRSPTVREIQKKFLIGLALHLSQGQFPPPSSYIVRSPHRRNVTKNSNPQKNNAETANRKVPLSSSQKPTAVVAAQREPFGEHEPFDHPPTVPAAQVADEGGLNEVALVDDDSLARPVQLIQSSTVRLLQHTMMFLHSMEKLRYDVPAMSLCWGGSCIVDKSGIPHIFGGLPQPALSIHQGSIKGCECGERFVALLSETGDVWCAGQLENQAVTPECEGSRKAPVKGLCASAMIISGRESRLIAATTSNIIRPLSPIAAATKTAFPYRFVKWVALGYRDVCYMVGTDHVLYKNNLSVRLVSTPRRVMAMSRIPVSKVSAGNGFYAVIDVMGHLWTVGKNKKGQLGNGKSDQDSVRVPVLHTEFFHHFITNVVTGDMHTVVLSSNGMVYGTGSNSNGQLGLGPETATVSVFTRIHFPGDLPCEHIAAGPLGTLFCLSDGTIYSCGSNECGQLGHPVVGNRNVMTPQPIVSLLNRGIAHYVATTNAIKESASNLPSSPDFPPTRRKKTPGAECGCNCSIS